MSGSDTNFPQLIACGLLDGTGGTPVITLANNYKMTTPVSSAKGVYTVVLTDRPAAANIGVVVSSLTDKAIVNMNAYVQATGLLTVKAWDDAGAAKEATLFISVYQIGVG